MWRCAMRQILSHPITVAVVSGLLLQGIRYALEQIGGPNPVETFWQNFVVAMWPMWGGLVIGVLYWFIKFLLRVNRHLSDAEEMEERKTEFKKELDIRAKALKDMLTPPVIKPPNF